MSSISGHFVQRQFFEMDLNLPLEKTTTKKADRSKKTSSLLEFRKSVLHDHITIIGRLRLASCLILELLAQCSHSNNFRLLLTALIGLLISRAGLLKFQVLELCLSIRANRERMDVGYAQLLAGPRR